ncbi:MAG: COQ9 family protein [Rickettsiales bacterium]|nr:COQ9 family protein [Rickettsiales bacterium]
MTSKKINIDKLSLIMLEKLNDSNDLDAVLMDSLKVLKIDIKSFKKIKETYYRNGLGSLMTQINIVINKMLKKDNPIDVNKFRISEKIIFYVFKRLKIIDKLCNRKKLFFIMMKPQNFSISNKILFKIADEIWFLAGDKSTDMNYYSKRIILMNIYASIFSFFVFDQSKDFSRTLNLLEKEINLVLSFGKIKKKISSFF